MPGEGEDDKGINPNPGAESMKEEADSGAGSAGISHSLPAATATANNPIDEDELKRIKTQEEKKVLSRAREQFHYLMKLHLTPGNTIPIQFPTAPENLFSSTSVSDMSEEAIDYCNMVLDSFPHLSEDEMLQIRKDAKLVIAANQDGLA